MGREYVGTGRLAFVEAQRDRVGGVNGLAGARDVAVTPDGAHVYVSGPEDDAVAAFARDPGTGALSFVGTVAAPEAGALAVSPDGEQVYVAQDGAVAVFPRDPDTGTLAAADLEAVTTPSDVAVSPDGTHVYVSSREQEAELRFARDGVTGTLTFEAATVNGADGVVGLVETGALAVSADGTHVYALGGSTSFGADSHATVLARDVPSGRLRFVGRLPLRFAAAVTSSPDSRHVYVARGREVNASSGPHAVFSFARGFSGCDPVPRVPCRSPGAPRAAKLELKDKPGAARDGMQVTWSAAGEGTTLGDFDVPTLLPNSYAVCVYDESGGPPALVLRALAVSDGHIEGLFARNWADSSTGFTFRDRFGNPEGIEKKMVLRAKVVAARRSR